MQVRNKYSYLVTFTNDLSKYCYVYPIKHKSECFENFKQLKSEVEKYTRSIIKILWSDGEGEYLFVEFKDYMKKHSIVS